MRLATSSQPDAILLGHRTLHALRTCLERETGMQAAALLQEAGFAGGESLHRAFGDWTAAQYGVASPGDLDARFLEEALSGFLGAQGWGAVTVAKLGASVIAIDSVNWAEAVPGSGADYPSCHLSSGTFADFFTRLSGSQTAVMEVECRSRGEERCRFLVGAPETLTMIYERMASGMTYAQSLGV